MAFLLCLSEERENCSVLFPTTVDIEEYKKDGEYAVSNFKRKALLEKLNWLYENCKFIPIVVAFESICIGGQYKFSYIKKNKSAMITLKEFLKSNLVEDEKTYRYCYEESNYILKEI